MRKLLVAAGAILGTQSAMIAALLARRARRRTAEARHSAMLEAMPDMMFVLTRDGRYVDFHAPDAARPLVPPDTFVGKHMRDVLPPDLAEMFAREFVRLTPDGPPAIVEYSLPMPDGDHYYEARIVLLQNDHVLSIVRDLTERRHAESALQEARVAVARAARLSAFGEFSATIAHEIRQPLTAIIMDVRSCLREIGGATPSLTEIRAGLLDIVEAAQRAEEVIQRSRLLLRDHMIERAPLHVDRVIEDALELARQRLQQNGVAVTTTLSRDLPCIEGDAIELQQVLLNLITNAIDALERVPPAARRIEVTSLPSADGVEVTVADNGVGFEGVDVRQMFALSYTTKATGSGVGLSVCRAIVEGHGGKLWAEANAGGGAIFRFILPAQASPVADARPSPYHVT